jgi:arginine deiminase
VAVLQKSNVRVLDTRRLAEDVFSLAPADEREQLLAEIVLDESEQELWRIFKETGQTFPSLGAEALQDMKGATPDEIVTRLYEGWSSTNWKRYSTQFGKSHVPLLLEMCNAYFTRDPGFTLNGLFVVSSMTRRIRQREARLLDVILRQHPWFSDDRSVRYPVQSFVRADPPNRIEGGDVVAIGPGELAIGLSERTSFEAIEALSRHLLVERDYQRIYVVPIPRTFAYMHLDTVFSLVSSDTAVCYPAAIGSNFLFFYFERSPSGKDIVLSNGTQPFLVHLQDKMGFKLVETAGGHPGLAMAEQYGDATNTLAIGNGRVIAYAENHTTNDCLRNAGIEVIEIKGSELVKGVGGPRCMTMPVQRGT